MSGFGIREQFQLGRELSAAERPLWRPASFLQQLSMSGSMLLVENHDRYWLAELGEVMGEPGRSWGHLSSRLRTVPGRGARRALWRASYIWWRKRLETYPEIAHLAWKVGAGRPESLLALETTLTRSSAQLRTLAWVEFDKVSREPISIVDLESTVS